jgi:hypothetical protein
MSDLIDYSVFRNSQQGKICFVVGAGTSLHGLNLITIHNHVVISVNSSIMLMPWQSGEAANRFWISNDSLVRFWTYWPLVKSSKCNKIVRDSWHKYYAEIYDFYKFSAKDESCSDFYATQNKLTGASSVPSAIDLALQMGCSKIFILGLDQYFVGDKTHFFDYLPSNQKPIFALGKLPEHVIKSCYDLNNKVFSYLQDFAEKINVQIYNCNRISHVSAFKKIDFSDIDAYL